MHLEKARVRSTVNVEQRVVSGGWRGRWELGCIGSLQASEEDADIKFTDASDRPSV